LVVGYHGRALEDRQAAYQRILNPPFESAPGSSDADCADHDPVHAQADRMLHGAASHGCLLVSETSCEARNVSVDCAPLVDTVATVLAAFF
jgi:hypothetical protein